MSFISTPENYPYVGFIRPLLFLLRRKTGALSEPVRLWARVPVAFLGFLWSWRALESRASPLPPPLRALIRTRISQLDVCAFCIDLNGSRALELGVAQDKLLALADFAASPLYDEAEKAALAFAETVTTTGRKVDAELMERLKRHYSDDAIVELAALIAHQNMSAKFNTALGVQA
ncbi:MAG: carboxymuconolactone decarboxylase family protein [Methylococcaceae bacterium]|nr:MAG: carboxymuconolactone decarboxylase family protein [Methylococcaceae bacterium]